jgi:hypothetical protein
MAEWQPLNNQPPFNADTMLLLTDGSVMCHEYLSPNWHRLVPDNTGNYLNGIWIATAPMPNPNNPSLPTSIGGPAYAPLYFASAVLKDGTVFVAGGEDNGPTPTQNVELLVVAIYSPPKDKWTYVSPPPSFNQIGDAPCCVLPNGWLLIGSSSGSTATPIFNPTTQAWVSPAPTGKQDSPAEETWTLMPNGNVLSVECSNSPNAEQYNPTTNQWIQAGKTPSNLTQPCPGFVAEIGPAILLPDGRVFAIGASGATALYTPNSNAKIAGTWAPGPNLTDGNGNTLYPMDAPAVLLANGQVLLTASPAPPCKYPGPTTFFLYNPATNKATIVPGPSNGSQPCFQGRMLLLPSGQVLYANNSNYIGVYTPDGAANSAWNPRITSLPSTLRQGHSEVLKGTLLNGLSQACSYGDDASMATNYPLVQVSLASGIVYARTHDHSTMAVATGDAIVSTNFIVPAGVVTVWDSERAMPKTAPVEVSVIANGIGSEPSKATILYSVRQNLKNDSKDNTPLSLNGNGLSSLVPLTGTGLGLGNPMSLRQLMTSLDDLYALGPWWASWYTFPQ